MELIVETDYSKGSSKLYLKTRQYDRVVLYGYQNGKMVAQTLDPGIIPERPIIPLLELPHDLGDEFFKAVLNYMSDKGIKTENENLLQGKLSATEKHLEDLRKHFDLVLNKVIQ